MRRKDWPWSCNGRTMAFAVFTRVLDGEGNTSMSTSESDDAAFRAATGRLLRREALRRAAAELNTTSGPGLEDVLARISAEVTAEAVERIGSDKA